jgi:hypothetical protein
MSENNIDTTPPPMQPVSTAAPQDVERRRYKTRFFVHYSEGNHAMAVLPSTWRAVELGNWQTRFDDSANGSTIRWVATRYVGQQGGKNAEVEISTAGSPADSKVLGAAINYATVSLALTG